MKSPSDKRLFHSFCLLLLWIPLPLGSNRPWAWSIMEVWVFSIMIFWCWLYYRGRVVIPATLSSAKFVLFIFALWLIYIALQFSPLSSQLINILSPAAIEQWGSMGDTILSLDRNISLVSWLLSLSYFLFFFLCLVLVINRRRLKILAYTLVYSGLFQALYGSVMTLSNLEYSFFIKKYAYLGNATGTFINRNHLAGYLEMVLAIGIGLLIASLSSKTVTTTTLKKKVFNFFRLLLSAKARLRLSLVMMVIALVLTHSRMGNTGFFASLFIAGVISLIFSKHATRSMSILLISLIVIDLLIVGQWFGFEKVKNRLEKTSVTSEVRYGVYKHGLNQWEDYRLVGSGLGSFYSVFPQYRGSSIMGYYQEAHNDYLQFAMETGIIGICLLGLITLSSLVAAIVAQHRRRDPLMIGISFSSIMGILAILIHSTVDFNLQIPANAATFMILLAFAWISFSLQKNSLRKNNQRIALENDQ